MIFLVTRDPVSRDLIAPLKFTWTNTHMTHARVQTLYLNENTYTPTSTPPHSAGEKK